MIAINIEPAIRNVYTYPRLPISPVLTGPDTFAILMLVLAEPLLKLTVIV